ncbi:condensation domain-containing protein [Mucilaginibacter sp. L196]|uniref:condensation domain-containing protein n=1 Tax=Mucilaginibacter sp. L196 TaxID=1641870 RepID=UPI00131C75A7|nr:condensation domain-containing protein [Mucilaginibacter sp. L196]
MKRKLLFAERMLHGDGTEPFNLVLPVKIRGVFPVEYLPCALKRLQQKHALLRAVVENDEHGMPWFIVKNEVDEISVRIMDRITDDDWQVESVKEWSKAFDTGDSPLMRLVWVKGPEVSELLLVMHHCFCDGEGAMSILNDLLRLLYNPDSDIGDPHDILSVEDIIPADVLKNKWNIIKAKMIGALAIVGLKLLPVNKKPHIKGDNHIINWQFDKELSSRLFSKCKSKGVTVNTALCMAVLTAFKTVRKEQFCNKISCPVNIRRFMPQLKKDDTFAFGLMLVVSLDKGLDFFTNAKKIQTKISRKTEKLNPYSTLMAMENAHPALHNFTRLLKKSKSSNDCMFSNLGRINIPYEYKSFTIETIFSPSVIGPLGNTTTLLTSTYKEIMDFTFIVSEGYVPYVDALAIKDKIIEIISTQLAI